jgi:PAS domain S-box-containing protein
MATNPASHQSLDALISHTRDGIFVVDRNRRFVVFNPACEQLTGHSASEVVGASCSSVGLQLGQGDNGNRQAVDLCPEATLSGSDLGCSTNRHLITTRDGQKKWIDVHYTPIYGNNGKPEYVMGVVHDVTNITQEEQHWGQNTDQLASEVTQLRQQLAARFGIGNIVTRSSQMMQVLERAHAAVNSQSPVLITGEIGTGKELLARNIHHHSERNAGSFVAVSCVGRSEEQLEAELFGSSGGTLIGGSEPTASGAIGAASNGTLYIEDISGLPMGLQTRLLRSIENWESDESAGALPRIIASTSRSLNDLVASNRIREDLFYRLSIITVELPPLRQRKEDIPLLVGQLVIDHNEKGQQRINSIDPGIWQTLSEHDWPGNVQELRNVIEAALAESDDGILRVNQARSALESKQVTRFTSTSNDSIKLDDRLADVERRTILSALRQARGQRSRAAKLMGISRSRLYRRMDALGIVPREENL